MILVSTICLYISSFLSLSMTDNIIIVMTTDYCKRRKNITEVIFISFLSTSYYLYNKSLVPVGRMFPS